MGEGRPVGSLHRAEQVSADYAPTPATYKSGIGPRQGEESGPEDELRIVSMGRLGGGLKYFGRENAVGLYLYLRDSIATGTAPHHIVIHGGLLPYVPRTITRGSRSEALVLMDGVNSVDDAKVSMLPYMTRISGLIKRSGADTGITYVMDETDLQNIKREYDSVVQSYNYFPDEFVWNWVNFRLKTEFTFSGIKTTAIEIDKLEKEHEILRKKLEKPGLTSRQKETARSGIRNYGRTIARKKEAIEQLRHELSDYSRILDLYTDLLRISIREDKLDTEAVIEAFLKATKTITPTKHGATRNGYNHAYLEKLRDTMQHQLHESIASAKGKSIDQVLKEEASILAEIEEQMKEIDATKHPKKFKELEERRSLYQDHVTKSSYTRISESKKVGEGKVARKLKAAERFTHNMPGPPDLSKIANDIAYATIMTSIRDTFGRRIPINIVKDQYSDLELRGRRIRVTNEASNSSSFGVKTKKRDEVMIALARGDLTKIDAILGASSPYVRETMMPFENRSGEHVYSLWSGPAVKLDGLREQWNKGRKTRFTAIVERANPSSGFDVVTFSKFGFKTHSFKTAELLELYFDREMATQRLTLAKMVKAIGDSDIGAARVDAEAHEKDGKRKEGAARHRSDTDLDFVKLDNKDSLLLSGTLPTELRQQFQDAPVKLARLLAGLGVDPTDRALRNELAERIRLGDFNPATASHELEKALPWFGGYVGSRRAGQSGDLKSLTFVNIGDAHIGSTGEGMPSLIALRASAEHMAGQVKGPFVLVLGGDNIEGNLKDRMHTPYPDNDPANVEKYREFLAKEKGMDPSSQEFTSKVEAYVYWLYHKTPIVDMTRQAQGFVWAIEPLLKKADAIIVGTGNHPRVEEKRNIIKEAREIRMAIESKGIHPKGGIQEIVGADWGQATISIPGGPSVYVSHEATPNQMDSMRSRAPIAFAFHDHVYQGEIRGNRLLLKPASFQPPTDYAEKLGISVDELLRGMAMCKVTLDQNNELLASDNSFLSLKEISKRGLIKVDPAILEFEGKLLTIRPTMQKARL